MVKPPNLSYALYSISLHFIVNLADIFFLIYTFGKFPLREDSEIYDISTKSMISMIGFLAFLCIFDILGISGFKGQKQTLTVVYSLTMTFICSLSLCILCYNLILNQEEESIEIIWTAYMSSPIIGLVTSIICLVKAQEIINLNWHENFSKDWEEPLISGKCSDCEIDLMIGSQETKKGLCVKCAKSRKQMKNYYLKSS